LKYIRAGNTGPVHDAGFRSAGFTWNYRNALNDGKDPGTDLLVQFFLNGYPLWINSPQSGSGMFAFPEGSGINIANPHGSRCVLQTV
jgi:hypothetical protein